MIAIAFKAEVFAVACMFDTEACYVGALLLLPWSCLFPFHATGDDVRIARYADTMIKPATPCLTTLLTFMDIGGKPYAPCDEGNVLCKLLGL